MEIFNILGHQISFEEGFSKCLELYDKKSEWIEEYKKRYCSMNYSIETIQAFGEYLSNMWKFMQNEYQILENRVLDVFANFQVFNKSREEIVANCSRPTMECYDYLDLYMEHIKELHRNIEDKKRQAANTAANNVDEYYLGVISTSSWDILVNDVFNEWESYKAEKKRERAYNTTMQKADSFFQRELKDDFIEMQQTIYKTVEGYGIETIEKMFDYCVSVLISENKIDYKVKEYLQKEKAATILRNLGRIQDNNIKKEQIIDVLQIAPLLPEVHFEIIKYIWNDVEEYLKLIKFIHGENMIGKVCYDEVMKHPNNEKYIDMLEKLGINNIYYQKYKNKNTNISTSTNANNYTHTSNEKIVLSEQQVGQIVGIVLAVIILFIITIIIFG